MGGGIAYSRKKKGGRTRWRSNSVTYGGNKKWMPPKQTSRWGRGVKFYHLTRQKGRWGGERDAASRNETSAGYAVQEKKVGKQINPFLGKNNSRTDQESWGARKKKGAYQGAKTSSVAHDSAKRDTKRPANTANLVNETIPSAPDSPDTQKGGVGNPTTTNPPPPQNTPQKTIEVVTENCTRVRGKNNSGKATGR